MVAEVWPPFRISGTETGASLFAGIDMDLLKVLTKPVSRKDLARAIRQVLDNAPAD